MSDPRLIQSLDIVAEEARDKLQTQTNELLEQYNKVVEENEELRGMIELFAKENPA